MVKELGFEIVPYTGTVDITTAKDYIKLNLNRSQQIQVEALIQQLPALTSAATLANAYTVSFPSGIQGQLMQFVDGGYGSPIMGISGIDGHASFHPLISQALAMGCFSVMSIATGQHYLKEINNELRMMRLGLDKILEFLYGDKKAELIAEVSFIRYAYKNYISIMEHEQQRLGVITGLFDAKKIAIKDIEFYLSDLESLILGKDKQDVGEIVKKAFQIKESLELAMQLYGMSSLLEVYYAQNFDSDYTRYVEHELSVYIERCEKQMLGSFSSLRILVDKAKDIPFIKKNTGKGDILKQIEQAIEALKRGEESEMRKSLGSALHAATQKADYYITKEGAVFLKSA